jgi:hypothetical protein
MLSLPEMARSFESGENTSPYSTIWPVRMRGASLLVRRSYKNISPGIAMPVKSRQPRPAPSRHSQGITVLPKLHAGSFILSFSRFLRSINPVTGTCSIVIQEHGASYICGRTFATILPILTQARELYAVAAFLLV